MDLSGGSFGLGADSLGSGPGGSQVLGEVRRGGERRRHGLGSRLGPGAAALDQDGPEHTKPVTHGA